LPKKSIESPFQALEEEAYHAFREWPVWLALRERELDAHLAAQRPPKTSPSGTPPDLNSRAAIRRIRQENNR
jgi:hypothetical protein